MKVLLTMLLATAGLWSNASAAAAPIQSQADLSRELRAAIEEEGLTGATWAVVTPEGMSTGAAGLADARHRTPLSADNKVQTGSLVKTLVAAGILRLVTEGRLGLDSPVTELLPHVELENPWAPDSPVLLRHLLDHTSGLDDARLSQVFSLNARPDTPLNESIGRSPLRVRSRPGSRLSYSNTGYTLLGMVIESVTGSRYEQYLDAELLRPLGMLDSTFAFVSQEGPHADGRLAMGHFEGGESQPAVPLYLRPAGQFTTTAADMGRFARFLMGNGQVAGKPFIAPELLRAMGQPTTTEAAMAGLTTAGYGLGLNSRDRYGLLGRCHVGTAIGFRANFCIFPEARKAFFIAANADVETANYERMDALLLRSLDIAPALPAAATAPPSGIGDWQGIYVLAPSRMESFAYVDRLLNFAFVEWDGHRLRLNPFQGTAKHLLPVGGQLFRADDRVKPSHALLVSNDGRRVISDGFRSYEMVSMWRMVPLWASFLGGVLALAYVLLAGIVRLVRRRLTPADSLLVPFVTVAALFVPIPFFLTQSFLRLGDLTPASALLAAVTAALPLAMLLGLWISFRRDRPDGRTVGDKVAMVGVFQWAMVLFAWDLLPLCLWA